MFDAVSGELLRRVRELEAQVEELRSYLWNIETVPPLHKDVSGGVGMVISLDERAQTNQVIACTSRIYRYTGSDPIIDPNTVYTWTKPSSLVWGEIELVGGGAGGGGLEPNSGAPGLSAGIVGAGGGAGGYARQIFQAADILDSFSQVTVGANGVGVTAGNGTDGQLSSFVTSTSGSLFVMGGKGGGQGPAFFPQTIGGVQVSSVTAVPGEPGLVMGFLGLDPTQVIAVKGYPATAGIYYNDNFTSMVLVPGFGGSTPLGSGGAAALDWNVNPGSYDGQGYGSGGAGQGPIGAAFGPGPNNRGGNGAPGVVIIREYSLVNS